MATFDVQILSFPFAWDTPNLDTGAALYTPSISDILYDGWIEIDTAWNVSPSLGDFGLLGFTKLLYNAQATPVDMTNPYGNGPTVTGLDGGAVPRSLIGYTYFNAEGYIPAKFLTADPVCVVVSQDGTPLGTPTGATLGNATLYLVIGAAGVSTPLGRAGRVNPSEQLGQVNPTQSSGEV